MKFVVFGLTCAVGCTGPFSNARLQTNHQPSANTSTAVSVIVEPSDGGSALLSALSGARQSVHMTMYLLTDEAIIAALSERAAAGVEVEVVLNRSFPSDAPSPNNDSVFTRLAHAGVAAAWAPSLFTFTHEKSVVIDGTSVWIMTMNASASALSQNREYLAIDSDAADVAEAEAQFAADFTGTSFSPAGDLLVAPLNVRQGLVEVIQQATQTIDFEVEEMSDPALTDTFCAAAQRGVTVRGVVAVGEQSAAEATASRALAACDISLWSLSSPYVHAKALVADGATLYVGSANFSSTSLDDNRELGLLTRETNSVTLVGTTIASDIANGSVLDLAE